MSETPADLSDLRSYVSDVEHCMSRWASFGAADSEPDGVFQWHVAQQLESLNRGEDGAIGVPQSVAHWQLYSNMRGANKVSRELASKTKRVNREIRRLTTKCSGWPQVVKWAQDYLWRVGLSVIS